ncbi:MAG: hypothetical protein A2X18_10050 [Bacteroidetes bacterium GWF2_40_14]|nr:MAG: hypothetical protein A2X18_10050 [Bacteroidetes bacterium GWF2_40_14]
MKYPQLHSIEEIRRSHGSIRNVNVLNKENLSAVNKIALWITNHVGSMGFFTIIFSWTALWLSWNTLAPVELRFDPFPAFVLWLFISNMIQICLMPLILIGQNLQAKHSEIHAEEEYSMNQKSEMEIETILMHLENQNELIIKILERLEKSEK